MATIGELARLIRSKNAGPFELTFDIMFADREVYERVKQSGNVLIKRADYARTFVNALARDPTLEDFAVRPGVTAGARIGRKRAEARGAIGIGV